MHELPPVLKTVQKPLKAAAKFARDVQNQAAEKPPVSSRNTPNTQNDKAASPAKEDQLRNVKTAEVKRNAAQNGQFEQTDVDFLNILAEQGLSEAAPKSGIALKNSSIDVNDETTVDVEMVAAQMPALAFADAKLNQLNLNGDLNRTAKTTLNADALDNLNLNSTNSSADPQENVEEVAIAQPIVGETLITAHHVAGVENKPVMPIELNDGGKNALAQAAAKIAPTAQKVEIDHASNDNVNADTNVDEPGIVSKQSASRSTALPEKILSGLVERLQTLTAADLEKAGIAPELVTKVMGQVEKLLAMAEGQGLSAFAEKLMDKLSGLLNQDGMPLEGKLKQLLGKMAEAFSLKQTILTADTKATAELANGHADLDGMTSDQPHAKQVDAARIKTNGAAQATSNTPPPVAAEVSQYANRYNKNQTAENSLVSEPTTGDSDEPMVGHKIASIYNSVKTGVEHTQNAANLMSALDKMNEKSPMDFLNQLQTNMVNQPLDPNAADNIVNIKLGLQNGKLAQNLPLNNMAFQMSKQFNRGNSEFQIRLDPAELGKINVKITVKQGGNVKAHMVVERNDVFELMQRDARALERALADAGFDSKNVEIELSLDQNAQNGGTFAENFFDEPKDQKSGKPDNDNKAPVEDEILNLVASHVPLHVTSTGIDRKI